MQNKASSSKSTNYSDDSEEIVKARCHYTRADVEGIIYDLYHDAHVQGVQAQLENKLFLKDATSDLPAVTNNEMRDEMPYGGTPTTEFQRMIRLKILTPRPRPPNFTLSEQWVLMAATIFVCGFLGYVVYDAVMATASEMLQRLLVISPLILIISVHWLSSGSQFNIPIPGSEPGAIHRAGGSPWGLAFVLLLLFFLISYQPSLLGLFF
ncbi:hypothetical protein D5086_025242 [Populus alba]|uniref:Uncharacterized protein n=1 Tax=Populus alba TaxID=43335 RepID=A0ACC4B0F0_POPAL